MAYGHQTMTPVSDTGFTRSLFVISIGFGTVHKLYALWHYLKLFNGGSDWELSSVFTELVLTNKTASGVL